MVAMITYDQLMLQIDHPLKYAILFTIPEFILCLMVGGHHGEKCHQPVFLVFFSVCLTGVSHWL